MLLHFLDRWSSYIVKKKKKNGKTYLNCSHKKCTEQKCTVENVSKIHTLSLNVITRLLYTTNYT